LVSNSSFFNCSVDGKGGALDIYRIKNTSVSNCSFMKCSAANGLYSFILFLF
jgi:hypothetical protein